MQVLLLSTYDLGHQPFSLASPAAKLKSAGAAVTCNDLAVDSLNEDAVKGADLIGLYLQMHTATRLSVALLPRLKALNPKAHIAFYGLYAPLNADYLKSIGGDSFIGGEFEDGLVEIYLDLAESNPSAGSDLTSTANLDFDRPLRDDLPSLDCYAHLNVGDGSTKIVGYTEASRGCKHKCRHCPIVPVYQGRFRIIPADVVLADIRQQINPKSGPAAEHISFGDPDFLNGPRHAMDIVTALHEEFPEITYDATIKVEHLLKHADLLPMLKETGCLFITTAVESVEEDVLRLLDKGHTHDDFKRAAKLAQEIGLTLAPTFVPFTPWTTKQGFRHLLDTIAELGLVENVAPIQLAIRLLIPNGSYLLDLPEIEPHLLGYDQEALSHRWQNTDESVEEFCSQIQEIVEIGARDNQSRIETFKALYKATQQACGIDTPTLPDLQPLPLLTIPAMSEPWFCCAEPSQEQLSRL
ncbi:MAG: radical SAM protein [Rhodospirillaceae bacterium]|jgi:radical SAM superfamily enzyme YgiQ (UPF0313 family)|nr:radical SAM protein [Rhodospirillaceae bacterium]MBT4588722.1 radical SAM protein [Rhodospirillaceae bacterium]MBT7265604.1 radical SAM protein [Rhodospirillaceae bacterium]